MVSIAEGWNDGSRSWTIAHNAQEGTFNLSAEREFPAHYEAIKTQFVSQQNAEGGEEAGADSIFL